LGFRDSLTCYPLTLLGLCPSRMVTATFVLPFYPFAKACQSATALSAAQFVCQDIIPVIGCPKIITSDNGTHFINDLWKALFKYLKIKHHIIPPYTPEHNPFVERFNGTLQYSLYKMVYHAGLENSTWCQFIPSVLFGYRVRCLPDKKYSPFYLLYGVDPVLPVDIINSSEIIKFSLDSRIVELDPLFANRYGLVRGAVHNDNIPDFIVGSFVWLLDNRLRKGFTKLPKFTPRYTGPFRIEAVKDHHQYVLEGQDGRKSIPIHVSRLIPFIPRWDTSGLSGGVS
jgi:hypothetical protein